MSNNIEQLPMLLTVEQLAELTGQHPGSIRRSVKEGRIPAKKIGGRIYIYRDAILPEDKDVYEESGDTSGTGTL